MTLKVMSPALKSNSLTAFYWCNIIPVIMEIMLRIALFILMVTPMGCTNQFDAAGQGDKKTLQAMLDEGADIKAKDKSGMTALMRAADTGRIDTLGVLLDNGADIDAYDKDDWTALMYAAKGGHKNIVRLLLSKGADVNARSKRGFTAFTFASREDHKGIAILLRKAEAEEKTRGLKADMPAAPKLKTEAAPPLSSIDRSLMAAVETGKVSYVQRMLDKGDGKSLLCTKDAR